MLSVYLKDYIFSFCQVFQSCQGNCYDTLILSSFCKYNSACRRTEYFRCYDKQTCTGVWNITGSPSQCSVTCGSGIKTLTVTCVDPSTGKISCQEY